MRSRIIVASTRSKASWSKCVWVDMATSAVILGNGFGNQRPQAPEGSLRQGSSTSVSPAGEVSLKAQWP